jgi:hypothetical protein
MERVKHWWEQGSLDSHWLVLSSAIVRMHDARCRTRSGVVVMSLVSKDACCQRGCVTER